MYNKVPFNFNFAVTVRPQGDNDMINDEEITCIHPDHSLYIEASLFELCIGMYSGMYN